jgi:serine/threonine-protein kinase
MVAEDPEHPWFTGTVRPAPDGDKVITAVEVRGRNETLPPSFSQERFEDKGEIAAGGTATIRRVFDRRIRRTVAMKVLDPMMGSWPEAARLLIEEAQITGQLDHPNIVPVHDLGTTPDDSPMFTMTLVEGRTLTDLIDERGRAQPRDPRALPRLLRIFLSICDALSFAHSRGVVHRDLKPDNVMIGSHGRVYVMDWGCALDANARRSIDGPGTVVGTGAYMAPEQAWGRTDAIDARTDVFALGGILYQILTRSPPYRGRNHLEAVQLAQVALIKPPEELVPDEELPRGLCRMVMRALDRDPSERYQTAEALKADVELFLDGGLFFEVRTFPAGAEVVREGDEADAAYIVVSGHCEAFRVESGRRHALRRMGPGEIFGETAVLAGGPRTASVVAIDELTCRVVSRESFQDELRAGSWVGILVKALAERFRDLDAQLAATRKK